MYTQTLYELSQEAERLLQLSRQQLQLLEKMPLSVPGDDAPQLALPWSQPKEGANKRGNSSRLTQSFHFFMFEPIFSPVNALNQPI